MEQWRYFILDVRRILGKRTYRIFYIWISRGFIGVFIYRVERLSYLIFGNYYKFLRILFLPLINLLQAYSNIHYKADIKGGVFVLHPSLGIVISGKSKIGKNLTLVGGNVIGIKKECEVGDFEIGNNCELGANATIIGPLKLGNNIKIGASPCVVKTFLENNIYLIGVPAKSKVQVL